MLYHNDTIIKDQRRLLNKYNMYRSLYCKGSKRGYSKFACERKLETEQNWNILTPTLTAVNVVSFSFSWCSTGDPWGPLYWVLASFTASYQQLLWSPNSIRVPEGPLGRVWLSLPYLVYNSVSSSNCDSLTSVLTELYIIVQRSLDRPLDLWNRMFNRHQAEVTVMQFTGHSLTVRQSMRVSWDFLACPILLANFHPRDFLS